MSVSTLNNIELQLGLFGIPTLLVLGNVANLLTVLILGRTLKQRINSCALYLLCSSIVNWLIIDTGLVLDFYGVDHIQPIDTSNFLCKLRWYSGYACFTASRSFLVAACVDRWALCSQNIKIRSICQPKIAYRVTVSIIISSALINIPLFFYFDNNSDRCVIKPSYNLAYTTYTIFIGTLPSLLIILFGFLARYNLTKIRSRVQPIRGAKVRDISIHTRDRDLMKMLFGEVFIFCVTTCPYPFYIFYNFLTAPITPDKSPLRVAIESLIGFIIHPLLNFTYCCTQFYIYAILSRKFREDFLDLFRVRRQTVNIQVIRRQTLTSIGRH